MYLFNHRRGGAKYQLGIIFLVLAIQNTGCAYRERDHRIHLKLLAEQYDKWSTAAQQTFASAHYFKPDTKSTSIDALAMKFAPLVVQESGRILPVSGSDYESAAPVVYVDTNRLHVGGTFYDQITYQWLAARDADLARENASGDVIYSALMEIRGLRITLGQDGFAAAIEIMQPGLSLHRVFVSKSLESTAMEAYAQPLDGRQFAVESSIDDAPHVLVVGVFDDGPVPMGPYVYLNAALDVTAIRCRCSSSLVDTFSHEAVYEWLPIEILSGHHGDTQGEYDLSIVNALRWPKGF